MLVVFSDGMSTRIMQAVGPAADQGKMSIKVVYRPSDDETQLDSLQGSLLDFCTIPRAEKRH